MFECVVVHSTDFSIALLCVVCIVYALTIMYIEHYYVTGKKKTEKEKNSNKYINKIIIILV